MSEFDQPSSTGTATTNLDPSTVLNGLLQKYPKIKAAHKSPVMAQFAPIERLAKAKEQYSGQAPMLEYWPPDESGAPEFPHPAPGNTVIELYDQRLKKDPQLLQGAIMGDLLHGMRNDPNFEQMRQQFKQNFTPQSLAMEKRQGRNEINDSRLDEYIRGYLNPLDTAEFMNDYKAGKPVYSPKQIEILKSMQQYLGMNGPQ